jgi:hypothetical protein
MYLVINQNESNMKTGDQVKDITSTYPDKGVWVITRIYDNGTCSVRRVEPIEGFGIVTNDYIKLSSLRAF